MYSVAKQSRACRKHKYHHPNEHKSTLLKFFNPFYYNNTQQPPNAEPQSLIIDVLFCSFKWKNGYLLNLFVEHKQVA